MRYVAVDPPWPKLAATRLEGESLQEKHNKGHREERRKKDRKRKKDAYCK